MTQPFYISSTFHTAWSIFKKQWWQVLIVVFCAYFLSTIVSQIVASTTRDNAMLKGILSVIITIANMVISMGAIKYLLAVARKQESPFSLVWSAAPLTVKYILGNILYVLIVIAGLLLLVVPGIYWAIKYSYIPYLIIDKGIGPMAAMKLSGKMTAGIKLDLLGFGAASIVVLYAGLIALLVGIFVTFPVVLIAQLLVYDMALARATESDTKN